MTENMIQSYGLTQRDMHQELISQLESYGLSNKEAKVYLVALEMGNSMVSTIARRCSLNRTSAYEILASLKDRGIAIESTKDDVRHYSVISPELLLSQLENKLKDFKESVPSFMALMGKWGNKPRVGFYDGQEGLKIVFEQVLNAGYDMDEPFLSFLGTNIDIDPKLAAYLEEEFTPKRLVCPIKTRVIASAKNQSEYLDFNLETHESVIIDDELFEMGNEIVIYGGNKVAVLMYAKDEQSGLIIESKTLHDGLKSLFNLIWKTRKCED